MASLLRHPCTLSVALLAVLFGLLPYLFDFGQCTRACTVRFGGLNTYRTKEPGRQILGFWTLTDRITQTDRCYCEEAGERTLQLGNVPRLNPAEEPGYPYIWRDPSVCGTDGKVYASAAQASSKGVRPLHCGPHCGECSTELDVKQYHEIGENVAKVVGPCIFSYLVGGSYVDHLCMAARAKFSQACTDCWVDDHGCLAAHCFYDCVFKGKKHWERLLGMNQPNEKTEDNETCLACMEKFCSAPFIRTCGVNRRSAGVRTDLARQEREICKVASVA